MLKNARMRLGAPGRFRTRPNASKWIRMGPNGSEHLQKPSNNTQNIKKYSRTFIKQLNNSKNKPKKCYIYRDPRLCAREDWT